MVRSLKKSSYLNRLFSIFFVCLFFMISVMPLGNVFAADAHTYYIQMAIDTSNWIFSAAVVNDKDATFGTYTEIERIGSDKLSSLKADSSKNMFTGLLSDTPKQSSSKSSKDNKVLSFPGFDTGGVFTTPQASSTMYDRATLIKDRLVYDLNTAIKIVYEDKKWANIDAFRSDVSSLLSAVESGGSINGWTINRASDSKLKDSTNEINPSDYIILKKDSVEYVLLTGVKKYTNSMSDSDKPSDESKDTKYVTWGQMVYEAFVNSTLDKNPVTSENVYNSTVQGVLESAVNSLFSTALAGVRSVLGLWDLDSLIFNKGSRGGSSFVAGIFPSSWETYIWTFFLISEILSFVVIMYAIIKHILNKAVSTVNPAIRANAMEQVKDMAIGIIVLVFLPGLLVGLMQLSGSLVDVFSSIIGDKSITNELGHFTSGNSIGAVFIGLANLIVLIYFNWFYIIREITTALLITLAPLFVATMCIGVDKRSLCIKWLSELMSNIFIQPIHAMLFAFIVLMPKTGRPVESVVLLYCLIPLTALMKGLIFPGTSDMAHRISQSAGNKAGDYGKKATRAAVAAGVGMVGAGVGLAAGGLGAGLGASGGATASTTATTGGATSAGATANAGNTIATKNINTDPAKGTQISPVDASKKSANKGAGDVGSVSSMNSDGKTVSTQSQFGVESSVENAQVSADVFGDTNYELGSNTNIGDDISQDSFQSDGFNNIASVDTNKDRVTNTHMDADIDKISKVQSLLSKFPPSPNVTDVLKTVGYAGKALFSGAYSGAKRGWRGDWISMLESATPSLSTRGYIENFKSSLNNMRTSGDIVQDASPTLPYQNVGDGKIISKKSLEENGIYNMQTFNEDGKQKMSYMVNPEHLSQEDSNNISQIASNPELQAMARNAGFSVDRITNADGSDTGVYRVVQSGNTYTGSSIPSIQGDVVSFGGDRNELIPTPESIRTQDSNYNDLNNYNDSIKQSNTDISSIRSQMATMGSEKLNIVRQNASSGEKSLRSMNSMIGKTSSQAVGFAGSIGGQKSITMSVSGNTSSATITNTAISDNGIMNFKKTSNGNVSYQIPVDNASNGRVQSFISSVISDTSGQTITNYANNGYNVSLGTIQDSAGNDVQVINVETTSGNIISNSNSSGGVQTYTIKNTNDAIIPDPVSQGGSSISEQQLVSNYNESAKQTVINHVNNEANSKINEVITKVPEIPDSVVTAYSQDVNSKKPKIIQLDNKGFDLQSEIKNMNDRNPR